MDENELRQYRADLRARLGRVVSAIPQELIPSDREGLELEDETDVLESIDGWIREIEVLLEIA